MDIGLFTGVDWKMILTTLVVKLNLSLLIEFSYEYSCNEIDKKESFDHILLNMKSISIQQVPQDTSWMDSYSSFG